MKSQDYTTLRDIDSERITCSITGNTLRSSNAIYSIQKIFGNYGTNAWSSTEIDNDIPSWTSTNEIDDPKFRMKVRTSCGV